MNSTTSLDFQGQKVMVTGASQGIGYGVARGFAMLGATVYILALGDDVHEAAAQLTKESGQQVSGWKCDITDTARVNEVFNELGPLDVFIANAGLEDLTPITDQSPAAEAVFRRVIDINIVGTYLTTRAAIPLMRKGGRIIITASIWGTSAVPELSAYVASKHANIGFMRSIAQELGPKGIRVNAVCPGWVMTGPALNTLKEMAREKSLSESECEKMISDEQSLPGIQSVEDVVLTYIYLASSLAVNITGQKINTDRGAVQG
ncbi:MAG: SDR family oxidoreductase [Oceanospirillaceae bacterium]